MIVPGSLRLHLTCLTSNPTFADARLKWHRRYWPATDLPPGEGRTAAIAQSEVHVMLIPHTGRGIKSIFCTLVSLTLALFAVVSNNF